jgi:hypothetical protein
MTKKVSHLTALGELEAFITAGVERMVHDKLVLQSTNNSQHISREMIRI